MKTPERMAAVDRAWLLMERPTNPMLVVGLLVLRGVLSHARLRTIVTKRFLAFERFRSVPVMDTLSASWAPAEQFNVDDHVLLVALPTPAGKRELEDLAGELASTPLHAGRPLWTFHLVEHYRGGSAIIVRIHHCYADGIALMHVLMQLADPDPGEPWRRTATRLRGTHGPTILARASSRSSLRKHFGPAPPSWTKVSITHYIPWTQPRPHATRSNWPQKPPTSA